MSEKVYRSLGADQAKVGEVVYFHPTMGDYTLAALRKTEHGVVTHTTTEGRTVRYYPTERVFLHRD